MYIKTENNFLHDFSNCLNCLKREKTFLSAKEIHKELFSRNGFKSGLASDQLIKNRTGIKSSDTIREVFNLFQQNGLCEISYINKTRYVKLIFKQDFEIKYKEFIHHSINLNFKYLNRYEGLIVSIFNDENLCLLENGKEVYSLNFSLNNHLFTLFKVGQTISFFALQLFKTEYQVFLVDPSDVRVIEQC